MSGWTRTDPGAGDMEVVRGWAATLRGRKQQVQALELAMSVHGAAVANLWQGVAATAWQAGLALIWARAASVVEQLESADVVISAYAARVEEIAADASPLKAQIVKAKADLARDTAQLTVDRVTDPTGEAAWYTQRRIDAAENDLTRAKGLLEGLADEREAADGALITAVDGLFTSSWDAGPTFATSAQLGALLPADSLPIEAEVFIDGLDTMNADQVHQAWEDLPAPIRQWLITNRPALIGNLDGVPFADRATANEAEVNRLLGKVARAREQAAREAEAETGLHGLDYSHSYDDRVNELSGLTDEEIRSLENIRAQLDDKPDAHVVALDLKHPGATRAAIAIGDLDTATHIGVFVPGISTRIGDTQGFTNNMDQMNAIRNETGKILGENNQGTKANVAQVFWLDYSAPAGLGANVWPALHTNRAEEGGVNVAGFGDGIAANNPGARTTMLAHSYGSVTATFGLTRTEAFDSFVAFGSPGLPQNAKPDGTGATYSGGLGINVPEDERYYGWATWDYVQITRFHGASPESFGFERLPTRAIGDYTNSSFHSGYLTPGSSFQHSAAAIVAGHPEAVPHE